MTRERDYTWYSCSLLLSKKTAVNDGGATGGRVAPYLYLYLGKSWIFSHSSSQATLDSIHTHTLAAETIATNPQGGIKAPDAGLRVLGAPVGHPDWCKQWLSSFVAELDAVLAELAAHDHKGATQAAFLILRYSAGELCFEYIMGNSARVARVLHESPPWLRRICDICIVCFHFPVGAYLGIIIGRVGPCAPRGHLLLQRQKQLKTTQQRLRWSVCANLRSV